MKAINDDRDTFMLQQVAAATNAGHGHGQRLQSGLLIEPGSNVHPH
jgi:hypothetical protein